jgi:hypothetical protein
MVTFGENTIIQLWVNLLTVLSKLPIPSPSDADLDLAWIAKGCVALVMFGAAAGLAVGLYRGISVVVRKGVVRKLAPPHQ